VHLSCGKETDIGGSDFRGLCDPVGGLLPTTTYCVHCAGQDSLDCFAWTDTRESLAAYRRRIRGTLSVFYVLKRRLLLLACLLAGPAAAYGAARLFPTHFLAAGGAGLLVGLLGGLVAYGAYLETGDADFRRYQ
jgi:hypothetical protein